MSVTYSAIATATTGSTASSSLTVNAPSGLAAGMFMILGVAAQGGTGTTITPPAGFASYQNNSNSTTVKNQNFYKVATASEPSSYTLNFSSSIQAAAACVSYTGVHPFQPVRVNNGTSTGVTSVPFATIPADWSGKGIYFAATSNTAGSDTAGVSSGSTQRADVCTTASPYIELALYEQTAEHDISSTTGVSNYAAGTVTTTQTVTYQTGGVWLDAAHVPVSVQNLSRVGVTGDLVVSDVAFGQLILNLAINRGGSQAVTTVTSSGIAGTWSRAASYNSVSPAGNLEVWTAVTNAIGSTSAISTAYSGSPVSTYNSSVTVQGAATHGNNGAAGIGATVGFTSSSAAPSATITTTKPNSMILLVGNDSQHTASITATGTGALLPITSGDGTNSCQAWWQYLPGVIPVAGTVVTMGDSTPAADSCNILLVEILAPPSDSASFADHVARIAAAAADSAAFASAIKLALGAADATACTDAIRSLAAKVADSATFASAVRMAVAAVDSASFTTGSPKIGLHPADSAVLADSARLLTLASADSAHLADGARLGVTAADTATFTLPVPKIGLRISETVTFTESVRPFTAAVADSASFAAATRLAVRASESVALADEASFTALTGEMATFADKASVTPIYRGPAGGSAVIGAGPSCTAVVSGSGG